MKQTPEEISSTTNETHDEEECVAIHQYKYE